MLQSVCNLIATSKVGGSDPVVLQYFRTGAILILVSHENSRCLPWRITTWYEAPSKYYNKLSALTPIMVVGIKIPPMAQLLNGMGLIGISGIGNNFCEKNQIPVFEAPREQLKLLKTHV